MHKCSLAKMALAGLALFSEEVALKSLITADLARAGYFKSLLRTAVRLHLGHGASENFFKDGKGRRKSQKFKVKSKKIVVLWKVKGLRLKAKV
jgi:hypothetical protein